MEYEIELKLLTNKTAGEVIDTILLPKLKADVKHDTLILTNHYFDTPDRTLRKNDIGLRIRGNNQYFEQTLKTAGMSIGGLHQRPEYNVSLDTWSSSQTKITQTPKLDLFPKSAWPEVINPEELQPKLEVLFTTHFKRESYLIALSPEDSVELVWDLGEIRSGNKSIDICEVELELKKGSTNALFELAKHLVQLLPTTIGIDSKAARGYSLLKDSSSEPTDLKSADDKNTKPEDLDGSAHLLEASLRHFQQVLSALLLNFTQQNAHATKKSLATLGEHVAFFAEKFPYQASHQHKVQLAELLEGWPVNTGADYPSQLKQYLTSAKTTQLQLDILQSLVEQPWKDIK